MTSYSTATQVRPGIKARRHDLDWLRVIAFGLLIIFHAAVAFVPDGIPMIINAESHAGFAWFVAFLSQFRLGLLFFVSGLGTYFALRTRNRRQFFRERTARLLIPLLFGIVVVVPPMVYLEKVYIGEYAGSLLEFYLDLPRSGIYPQGNVSWHHYWFVAYLFLHCIFAWPLFDRIRKGQSTRLQRGLDLFTKPYGIYWMIVPLILVELPLRAIFPGFRNLVSDWASFFHWYQLFIAGFVFAAYPVLIDRSCACRHISLLAASACSLILFLLFWQPEGGLYPAVNDSISVWSYCLFCFVRMANAWLWTMACLGFACRYLNRPSNALSYLNRAVYPMFCVHLTALVGFEYLIFPLELPVLIKFFLISLGCAVVCVLANEVAQRSSLVGVLFGVKPK